MQPALGGVGADVVGVKGITSGEATCCRSCCCCPLARALASAARRTASDTRCTGSKRKGAVFGSVSRWGRTMRTQGAYWEHGSHVLRAKDVSIGSAHTVTHGAAVHQGLQHTLAQAGFPTTLLRSVGMCRWADVVHRFRPQWRRVAVARMPRIRSIVKRLLNIGNCERRRDPYGLDWGVTTPGRRRQLRGHR